MVRANGAAASPTRARRVIAAVIVALVVVAVWAVIEYRQKPQPPPNKIEQAR